MGVLGNSVGLGVHQLEDIGGSATTAILYVDSHGAAEILNGLDSGVGHLKRWQDVRVSHGHGVSLSTDKATPDLGLAAGRRPWTHASAAEGSLTRVRLTYDWSTPPENVEGYGVHATVERGLAASLACFTHLRDSPEPPGVVTAGLSCKGWVMAEGNQLLLWRALHERARDAYDAAAASCSKPQNETPAGVWTAAEVMEHVQSEHSTEEGRSTDDLVQLQMLTLDLSVHSWDLTRSQGADAPLDDELCRQLHDAFALYTDLMARDGAFAPPVPVGAHASPVARLVALCGRDPEWGPSADA